MARRLSIWRAPFWKATAERAIATGCEVAIPVVPANLWGPVNVQWAVGIVASSVLLSVLKSLYAATRGNSGPSLTSAEQLPSS